MDKLLKAETITERNIKAIYEAEKAELEKEPWTIKLAHRISSFSGSITFVFLNASAFISWILVNTLSPWQFDPYPFTLLTLAVSLEAIFLSIFILISQNTQTARSEREQQLDLQINILSEEESTAALRLLNKMAEKLGISEEDRAEAASMSSDTNPEEVLKQIAEIENQRNEK